LEQQQRFDETHERLSQKKNAIQTAKENFEVLILRVQNNNTIIFKSDGLLIQRITKELSDHRNKLISSRNEASDENRKFESYVDELSKVIFAIQPPNKLFFNYSLNVKLSLMKILRPIYYRK
jgi:hypothetical protein